MPPIRKHLTYANVMSTIAVFLLLGGATAFAASKLSRNSVGTRQLKANSVTAAKLRANAVTERKVQDGAITSAKIGDGAVIGAKVQAATLGTVPSAATLRGYQRTGIVRVPANPDIGPFDQALAAAPEVPLLSAGPFTVYAKCFDSTQTHAVVLIRTSEDGAIFEGDSGEVGGSPRFLNRDTPEEERILHVEFTGQNQANYFGVEESGYSAMAPGGAVIRGDLQMADKNGTLPAGNGIYGSGNVCLFAAEMTALNG
jgi:hypothetical protein